MKLHTRSLHKIEAAFCAVIFVYLVLILVNEIHTYHEIQLKKHEWIDMQQQLERESLTRLESIVIRLEDNDPDKKALERLIDLRNKFK